MKMPDRPGGAGGSLIRANLFDTEDTPPFSRTVHGANVIHKRNGDLLVTRAVEADTRPPWLLSLYSYDAALFSYDPAITYSYDDLLHRFGLDDEDRMDQVGASPPNTDSFKVLFVGDGFVLDAYQNTSQQTFHLRLRSVDDLESSGALDLGVSIGMVLQSLGYTRSISLCATGWESSERGYGFSAYYFDPSIARYVCLSGCTRKPLDWSTAPMPGEPLEWWTPSTMQGANTSVTDFGYGKCYAVGRGHLLALLMPRVPIEVGKVDGVAQFAPQLGFLPVGGAPQLLRSRDFGRTWTQESAPFLAVDGVRQASAEFSDTLIPAVPYNVPVRLFAWASNFYACPIGGGRIAIAAGGPSTNEDFDDSATWVENIEAQTLRFYVSGTSGTGFVPTAWPLDAGRNRFPFGLGTPEPGTVTILSPLFGIGDTNQHSIGTMGPGTFFVLAVQITRTTPGFIYGPYPSSTPVLAFVTRDFGASWSTEQIPAEILPMASSFYENKAAWAQSTTPIVSGDGTQVPDSWPLYWVHVCVINPANTSSQGGQVALFTGEMTKPRQIAITAGNQTFGSISRALNLERGGFWTPHPELNAGMPVVYYTGDVDNMDYPEAILLGYPEFEDRT